jgi:ABC-type multidrug transport system fused ATPase/permease subunit
LAIIFSVLVISLQFSIGIIFDRIFDILSNQSLNQFEIIIPLAILGFLVTSIYVAHVLFLIVEGKFVARVTQIIRSDIFKSLQKQSQKFYDEESTGDLVTKATTDLNTLNQVFIALQIRIPIIITSIILILSFQFFIHPTLGLISFCLIPVILFFIYFFEKNYSPVMIKIRNQFGELNKILQEDLEGVLITKIFSNDKKNVERYLNNHQNYYNLRKKSVKLRAMLFIQNNLLIGIITIIILFFGGNLVINNIISVGMLISAIFLANNLNGPISESFLVSSMFSEFKASGGRIVDILEGIPTIKDSPDAIDINQMNGEINFQNVVFSYGKEPVLSDINLRIPANSSIGILGSTGSGKSSLINLINRIYDVTEGQILIDGIDIRNIKLQSLRNKIGFIDQETFLFSRTIKENILFGKPDATDKEIFHVTKIAQIHNFIMSLPDDYDTIIGERGVTLSGGQKQRISIARALLINPTILIFDDSLSAVDLKTEHNIKQELQAFIQDKTVIFVTQRVSITSLADQIIIMDKGNIIEQGKHNELLIKDSLYNRLCMTQSDDIIDLTLIHEKLEELSV